MPECKLMAEEWDEFARLVLPKDVSQVQRQEMRRAFYAGAQSIIFRVMASLDPGTETTDVDLRVMENLEREFQEFGEAIQQGRA